MEDEAIDVSSLSVRLIRMARVRQTADACNAAGSSGIDMTQSSSIDQYIACARLPLDSCGTFAAWPIALKTHRSLRRRSFCRVAAECMSCHAAFYFALTTIATVGYGDITAGTTIERLIAIGFMVSSRFPAGPWRAWQHCRRHEGVWHADQH